jgi:hypothetical protein
MKYVIDTIAKRVEEKRRAVRSRKVGDSPSGPVFDTEYEKIGWWITLDGVSFLIGNDEPEIRTGDKIRITIEKL